MATLGIEGLQFHDLRHLPAVIAGFDAAWAFFGGVFHAIIPDNMAAIVDRAHPTDPRLNRAFAEYAQDRGC